MTEKEIELNKISRELLLEVRKAQAIQADYTQAQTELNNRANALVSPVNQRINELSAMEQKLLVEIETEKANSNGLQTEEKPFEKLASAAKGK